MRDLNRYLFRARVLKVEHRKKIARAHKENYDAEKSNVIVEEEELGWFAVIEGWGAIPFGSIKPDFEVGKDVTIAISRPGDL